MLNTLPSYRIARYSSAFVSRCQIVAVFRPLHTERLPYILLMTVVFDRNILVLRNWSGFWFV